MGLNEYRRKRDFKKTPEPRGKRNARPHHELTYIIQKHDASHLHYDFRLELNGVLKSWAVPKGPDLDPAIKRLAMQVEDHPLEYGGFEGIIPEGEYGGGTVMLWDKGVWEPLGDAARGVREGHLKFILRGEKLQGAWMLVRKGGRKAAQDERHWFLFKERDEFARPGESITEELPLSVTTGRDLDEIAAQSDRVWGPSGEVPQNGRKTARTPATARKSNRPKRGPNQVSDRGAADRRTAVKAIKASNGTHKSHVDHSPLRELLAHAGVRRSRLPKSQAVELATLVDTAPPGDDWLHEIKFDGYRMICRLDKGKARFISRNGHDWTERLPELALAAGDLAVDKAMLDGEVVALNADGTTSFQSLQNVFQTGRTGDLVYYVFDILHLDGRDITGVPLEVRKEILKLVIAETAHKSIRFSDHLQGTGREIIDQACHLHLEGIISKRRNSVYRPGRGLDWLKAKCSQRAEFVVGGFTKPSGKRPHFGALLLGYYDRGKKLIYAGRVGTGFNEKTLAALHKKLTELKQSRSPYSNLSGITGQARDVSWVKPVLVAEIEFSNWTDDRHLRHPTFQGLREDKPANAVIHDEPLSVTEVKGMTNGKGDSTRQKGTRTTSPATRRGGRTKVDSDADFELSGVHLSHPDKILFPDHGLTKRDLANYYTQVADWMLPHVVDRPLAIVRCPAGSGKPCFFQKHPGEGASNQLRQVNISAAGKPEYHVAIDDVAGLISLVQMGVLEIHVWGSRAEQLEKPDRLIFDLDPDPAVDWPQVVNAARAVRGLLEELGLTSFLKTTGGKGLHLVVPVVPRLDWSEAKSFCRAVADLMVQAAPDQFIATMSKAARKGKIFIDYLRNGRGATSVAPYSTRAKPGATVSAPISWEELSARLHSDHFTIENLPLRLSKLKKDPWANMAKTKQSITAAMLKRLAVR
jgi:bifunctional non-homologous end joining protein LigD